MAYWLDATHEKVIRFLRENSGRELTLMEIWNAVGLDHSQKVLNKLDQLERKWYIRKNFELKTYDVLEEPIKDVIYLPLYGSVLCGNRGSAVVNESPTKTVWFNTSIFGINNTENYILVQAKWTSMNPEIKEGDVLLVHRQKDFSPQDKVLLVHENKPKVKTILKTESEELYLVSSNQKEHPTLQVSPEDIDVIWVVKKIISNP